MLNRIFVSYSMAKKKSAPAKSNGKGYTEERLSAIVRMDTYLKDSNSLSVKQFCRILREEYNVGHDYTDNVFYQRILKLRTGEYKEASSKELSAITRLIHVERHKHQYGAAIHQLGQIERKTAQIEKYLLSGYINHTEAKKRIKELKSLNPLSITHITE